MKLAPLERARALRREGKREQAATICEELLARDPRDADALFLAASLDLEANRFARARARLEAAVELRPDRPAYFTNLGIACGCEGALEPAEVAFRRALALAPAFVPALHHLGVVLTDLRRFDEGLSALTTAANAEPKSLAIHYALVKALVRAKRPAEAATRFDRAILLAPKPAELCLDFAAELERAGALAQAEALARRSSELAPRSGAAFAALGRIQARRGADQAAAESLERASELEGALRVSLVEELATLWLKLGCLDEAVACRERALVLEPNLPDTEAALIFLSSFQPNVSAEEIRTRTARWNERYAVPRHARRRPLPHVRDPERRLRVGYVSPNFRAHVQRFFVLPVLGAHARDRFEVVCYSSVKYPDAWTARIRSLADAWHDVSHLNDAALAELIREHRIDVLVDLTLHMPGCRLLAFAERPAPVQLAWLAYPGTTGVDGIDYRITDPVLDPTGTQLPYSERTLWLPHSFWCFDPLGEDAEVTRLPALEASHVTFGCLNNFIKVNPETLALWARVLRALPESRLLVLAPAGPARDRMLTELERLGVNGARVECINRLAHAAYRAAYQRIDVALDCVPANGHTTSLDAFWMGVPVVTRVGATIVGRAGASMARNLDLDALVAENDDAFVRIAVELARDRERLVELRRGLRERMRRSPLLDAQGFTRALEHAYRTAWRDFCAKRD